MEWSSVEYRLSLLSKQAADFGVAVDDDLVHRCQEFARILLAANETRNLTRLTTPEGLAEGMFLDSLLFLHGLQDRPCERIIDVGCGAGFPAIPLALARPNSQVVAVDSRKMKVDFVAEVGTCLGVTNLDARHCRAQDVPHATFDVATARAVGDLPKTLRLCLPLVAPGGHVIVARGAKDLFDALRTSRVDWPDIEFDAWHYRLPGYRNDFAHIIALKRV